MPAHAGGEAPVFALKEIVVAPANSERGLDPHQGAVLLHDGVTGQLVAVLNASPITEIRTAAVSAAATKLLARPGSRTVAVLGSGVQGRSHVDAMQTVLDDPIIRIWSRNPAHAEALALETHSLVAASVEEALDGAEWSARRPRPASRSSSSAGWRRARTSMPPARSRTGRPESSAPRRSPRRDSSSTGASRRSTSRATTGSPSRSRASGRTTSSAELGELLAGAVRGPPLRRRADAVQVDGHRRRGSRRRASSAWRGPASAASASRSTSDPPRRTGERRRPGCRHEAVGDDRVVSQVSPGMHSAHPPLPRPATREECP